MATLVLTALGDDNAAALGVPPGAIGVLAVLDALFAAPDVGEILVLGVPAVTVAVDDRDVTPAV